MGVHETNLEAHLVIALSGATMGDVGAAKFLGCFHEVLDNERARNCRNQGILLHVHAVRFDGRQAVFVGEFVLGVDHDGFDCTTVEGTLANALHVLAALTKVKRHGDNLTARHLGEVWDGDGGVKATGICEYDACAQGMLL